jgi:hypothetical protein
MPDGEIQVIPSSMPVCVCCSKCCAWRTFLLHLVLLSLRADYDNLVLILPGAFTGGGGAFLFLYTCVLLYVSCGVRYSSSLLYCRVFCTHEHVHTVTHNTPTRACVCAHTNTHTHDHSSPRLCQHVSGHIFSLCGKIRAMRMARHILVPPLQNMPGQCTCITLLC